MDRDPVKDLARTIIIECAPDELELFDSTADRILDDLPRAVAGDKRLDTPTASGIGVVVPVMVKFAIFLADHLVGAAAEIGLVTIGDKARERRRRKIGHKSQSPIPQKLVSIEVNRLTDAEGGIEIIASIPEHVLSVNAGQAASLIQFVAGYLVSVQGQEPDAPSAHEVQD